MTAYIDDLRARLEHLCAACGVPMPNIFVGDGVDPIVRLESIKCPPLRATCPADHRVRSWEIARIWWGIAANGRPFWQQQEMARHVVMLGGD